MTMAPACAHRSDQPFVGGGDIVAEYRAAEGGAQSRGFLQVLDPDRQAVQRRQPVAAGHRGIGILRGGAGPIEVARDHGVDRMVHRLDARDAAFQQLGRRELLLADQWRA